MVTRDIGVQTDPPPSPPAGPSNQAANPVPTSIPEHPEQPVALHGDFVEAASDYEEDLFENGRRYHSYREGEYWGPNDEKQNEQLDLAHHMFSLLLENKLVLAPIDSHIQKVLDVGTGTGIWAIDFADEYPSAEVIGTDLSPTQPALVPPNLRFEIDDACSEWTYPESFFDLIHVRSLYGAIADWPAFYRTVLKHLKPDNHVLAVWSKTFIEAGERFGKTFRIADLAKGYLQAAGFTNVVETRYELPVGGWSSNQHMRRLGRWNLLHCEEGIEGWAMALLTRVMGWSYEEVQVFLAQMRKGLRDPETHAYFDVYSKSPAFYNAFGTDKATFTTASNELHRVKRAALNPLFSRKRVLELEEVVQSNVTKLESRIRSALSEEGHIDLHHGFRAISVDVISDYAFNKSYQFLDEADFGVSFFNMIRDFGPGFWFFQQFPALQPIAFGLPFWLVKILGGPLKRMMMLHNSSREHIISVKKEIESGEYNRKSRATIFHRLLSPDAAVDYVVPTVDELKDEAYIIVAAAADTTGNALTIAAYNVVLNQEIYRTLTKELEDAFPDPNSRLDFVTLQNLPYLTAVVKEALRLSCGVPGRLPRVVPESGAEFHGYHVPAGTIVSMSSWTMHHNEELFPEPMKFNPSRWMGSSAAEKKLDHYLVSFGKGSRQCVVEEALPAWASLSGIQLHGVKFAKLENGTGIAATEDQENSVQEARILMKVPPDMVLSLETVHGYAKSDRYLREVLEALGDFGRTARGAILVFLLCHITYHSDTKEKVGVVNPWSEYIKFLPREIPLPTLWMEDEAALLYGTSLRDAVEQKHTALESEFERLRTATESVPWCNREWWDVETGNLGFEDWKIVDAMYRSRALDLPGTGHAMVPCVDMANHASGEDTIALYETDTDGNAVLQLRWDKKLHEGDEVTITYGDEKGASEMIFSYGFLEQSANNARQIFLSLDIPDEDPLKAAKKHICAENTPPGLRLWVEDNDQVKWESDFVYWACINEEDGLALDLIPTQDGPPGIRALWKGEEIGNVVPGISKELKPLRNVLSTDSRWEIFQLRAVVLVQQRLQSQLNMLTGEMEAAFEEVDHDLDGTQTGVRSHVYAMIQQLRILEIGLLRNGLETFAKTIDDLMASETVAQYLIQQSNDPEDFS
ncbi:Trichodiene oxygenase [Talaromyces islandicus]|uniref:Trichodiene oxygenase n=1 Tax=Talaromyces islandicus TaxID=28573 RepID=A0A0U1M1Z1_TALIS|nr:Trichodiene oxygenase [Talaromyces islandicus]